MASTPAPTATTPAAKQPLPQGAQLDLAFLLDSTGSMGSYIHKATTSIEDIVSSIVRSERADVRFALIAYRDHPPQDSTFITKKFDFTNSTATMKSNLATLQASGGGDGPEAVTTALYDALHLPWRPNATKMAVIIADAPPHGLGENGDGFPNGEPNGHDPLVLAREMAAHGITIYSVGCEPTLSQYSYAVDFFRAISKITGGSLLPLVSANILPEVIIGGAREQMHLELVAEEAYRLAEENRNKGMAEKEVADMVYSALKSKNVQSKQLRVESLYETSAAAESNLMHLEEAKDLKSLSGSKKLQSVGNRLKTTTPEGISIGGDYSDRFSEPPGMTKMAKKGGFMGFFAKRSSKAMAMESDAPVMAPVMMAAAPAAPASASAGYSAAQPYSQKVEFCESEDISYEQVTRLVSKSKFSSNK